MEKGDIKCMDSYHQGEQVVLGCVRPSIKKAKKGFELLKMHLEGMAPEPLDGVEAQQVFDLLAYVEADVEQLRDCVVTLWAEEA
jgi:hypothetical protein